MNNYLANSGWIEGKVASMRRVEIIHACRNVLGAINDTDVENILDILFRHRRGKSEAPDLLSKTVEAFKKYVILSTAFGASEHEITRILGISEISSHEFWSILLNTEARPDEFHEKILSVYSNLRMARKFLPTFVKLIETEAMRSSNAFTLRKQAGKAVTDAPLNVIILENKDEDISNIDRIVAVLESVKTLYEVAAKIEGISDSDLGVIGCDSGSDKSFDFIGSEKAIQRVKEIILSVWDRVIFHQENKVEKRLDVISKSIPIIEEIKNKKKTLGAEQAKLLEKAVLDGVKKFVESGAMIPEIQEKTSYNPRELLAPQPKLLTHHDLPDDQPSTSNNRSRRTERKSKSAETAGIELFEGLTEAENLELLRRLRELRDNNGDDSE